MGQDGKRRTVIYRRIGPDLLPDGEPHPSPRARLERQFLIKLQGEERSAREASSDEIWKVHRVELELGRSVPLIHRMVQAGFGKTAGQKKRLEELRGLGWQPLAASPDTQGNEPNATDRTRGDPRSVDELMSATVRTLRWGLRRHADRARIAGALSPAVGDGQEERASGAATAGHDGRTHLERVVDALCKWHALFATPGWNDEEARCLWEQHIQTLPG